MNKGWGKKGQFFIIAASVIIVVIVSFITISNYTTTKEEVKLYDLGQEMGIESQQVIDSGTYNGLNSEEMKTLMENFAKNYVNYIEEEKNIYFVFGNKDEIHVLGYQQVQEEQVCIELKETGEAEGGEEATCEIEISEEEIETTQDFPASAGEISKVVIIIGTPPNEMDYTFKLNKGENFYFVIWREIGGEKHLVTSNDEKKEN